MRFEDFKEKREIVKNLSHRELLFLYYLITEEVKSRGGKVEVLEELKKY